MKRTILLAILMSAALITGAFIASKKTQAQSASGLRAFGGQITNTQYCCNGIILTVSGQYGGEFFIDYASIAIPTINYANYQVYYGQSQYTLGNASSGGVCVTTSSECESSQTVSGGNIVQIGTGYPGGSSGGGDGGGN